MFNLKRGLLAGAALLATAGAANATTQMFSAAFGPMRTDFTTDTLTLPGFDATMGTLTGVSLTLSATENFSGSLTNASTSAQAFDFSQVSRIETNSTLSDIDALFVSVSKEQDFGETKGDGTTALGAGATVAISGSGTQTAAANPTDFASFENGNISFTADTKTSTTFTGGGGNIQNNVATQASGTVSVAYTFTPTPVPTPEPTPTPTGVPEPASMALIGAGLAGLGLLRRRCKA